MNAHRLARKSVFSLSACNGLYERHEGLLLPNALDLASNTTSAGKWAMYPAPRARALATSYLSALRALDGSATALTADNILFTRGVTEGIDLCIRTFCEPLIGSVVIPTPTFFLYRYFADAADVRTTTVPRRGERFELFDVPAPSEESHEILFVCSPNNPTGTTLARDHLLTLLAHRTRLVIVDEAYIEFSDVSSAVDCVHDYDNLLVLRSFSKAWGCAGLRAGVILGCPSAIHSLAAVQGPFAMSSAVSAELEHRFSLATQIRKDIKELRRRRAALTSALREHPAIVRVFPSDANSFPSKCRISSLY